MSLGTELIDELRRRRLYGSFFDYPGYQSVRLAESFPDLWDYLQNYTSFTPPPKHDPASIVDWMMRTGFSSVPSPEDLLKPWDPLEGMF